jgi:hypothetical protein
MQLDRDVQVCGIFLFIFSKYSALRFSSCFQRGVMLHIFFYALWLEHIFFFFYMLIWAIFSMTPFSFCKKRNLFGTWSTYFWWMDGMFCVTPSVGVSMYMWVYVISTMEAWKDSTKGHNNLAKLNGSQASICRRFMPWHRHMALVGNMTIEDLVLFLFSKRNSFKIFTILWDRARPRMPNHIILVNTLSLVISICIPQGFNSGSCFKEVQQIHQAYREYNCILGSCKGLA